MKHSPETGTAGFPAASPYFLRLASEQDREIASRIDRGDSRHEICRSLRIGLTAINGAVGRVLREQKGMELLAVDPQSLEGLYLTGQLPGRAMSHVRFHHHKWEAPELRRLSDVAALGRLHWSYSQPNLGPKTLEVIDGLLKRAGIQWADDECAPARRQAQRNVAQPAQSTLSAYVIQDILRRLFDMENLVRQHEAIIRQLRGDDIASNDAEASAEDLETAGNLVCLPGVKLSDILSDGGRS